MATPPTTLARLAQARDIDARALQEAIARSGQRIDPDMPMDPEEALALLERLVPAGTPVPEANPDADMAPEELLSRPPEFFAERGRGPVVRALQKALLAAGHSLLVDGVLGPATLKALKAVQARGGGSGVPATGAEGVDGGEHPPRFPPMTPTVRRALRAAAQLAEDAAQHEDGASPAHLMITLAELGGSSRPDGASREGEAIDLAIFRQALTPSGRESPAYPSDYLPRTKMGLEAVAFASDAPFSDDAPAPALSPALLALLDEAALAPGEPGRPLDCRDLLAVLLKWLATDTEPDLVALLDGMGLDARRIVADMLRHIVRTSALSARRWREFVHGQGSEGPVRYVTDAVAGATDDRLDVERYAAALASVITASKVVPPVALGVFGDWGSGKSFFMGLLEREVAKFSARAAQEDAPHWCRRTVSVHFNAWTYVDSDLWASLAIRIFDSLAAELAREADPRTANPEASVRDALRQRIASSQAASEEASAIREAARRERDEAQRDLDATRARRALTARELGGRMLGHLKDQQEVAADIIALHKAGSALGLMPPGTAEEDVEAATDAVARIAASPEQMRALASEMAQAMQRGQGLLRMLLAPFLSPTGRERAFGLLAVSVLAIALVGMLPGQLGPLTQLAGAVGGLLAWLGGQVSRVKAGLDAAESLHDRMRAMQDRLAVAPAELPAVAALREQLAALDARIEDADHRIAESERRIEEAQRELDRIKAGGLVYDFLLERRTSTDYRGRLGLISTLRSDFDALKGLLDDWHADRARDDGERADRPPRLAPIDRIVLYVDDLDRCPSERVVQVLEAIHLLLALPLFVVVVGVDLRWVARSLQERYPRHLVLEGGVAGDDGTAPSSPAAVSVASALDYLEKIFQIPFWLPPMDEDGSAQMISSLLGGTRDDTAGNRATRRRTTRIDAAGRPDGSGAGQARDAPADTGGGEGGEGGEASDGMPGHVEASESAAGQDRAEAARQAEAIELSPGEQDYMLALSGCVGRSPRRLKRFVNVYRILRASCRPERRRSFVRDAEGSVGEYIAAMTLLALCTGAPRRSPDLLRRIGRLAPDAGGTLIDALMPDDAPQDEETASARAALAAYAQRRGDDAAARTELREWIGEVSRFTFRSGTLAG